MKAIEFSKSDWQLIAAACAVVAQHPNLLINGKEKVPTLKSIAISIATVTGKME